jgi:hypothetical protein
LLQFGEAFEAGLVIGTGGTVFGMLRLPSSPATVFTSISRR